LFSLGPASGGAERFFEPDDGSGPPTVLKSLFRRVFAAAGTLLVAAILLIVAGSLEMLRPSFSYSQTPPSPTLGRICPGDTIARMSVSRLKYEAPVREGADADTLAQGPGHVPGTALPGEDSGRKHSVIALARDAGAGFVSQLVIGDVVELRTPFGLRSYRVVARSTVKAEDLRIEPTDEPTLTLVAPYPADSVGPAPLRLAIRAEPTPPGLAPGSSEMSSATRSTGVSAMLAEAAVSEAFPEGR
jgi:sortase A